MHAQSARHFIFFLQNFDMKIQHFAIHDLFLACYHDMIYFILHVICVQGMMLFNTKEVILP